MSTREIYALSLELLCIMDFDSHRRISLILIGRSAMQLICGYDVYLGVPIHSIA